MHKIGEGLHKIGELLTDTGFCNYITIYNNAGLILSTPHINNVYIKPSLTYRLLEQQKQGGAMLVPVNRFIGTKGKYSAKVQTLAYLQEAYKYIESEETNKT